jgi:hypothetical protein
MGVGLEGVVRLSLWLMSREGDRAGSAVMPLQLLAVETGRAGLKGTETLLVVRVGKDMAMRLVERWSEPVPGGS